MKKKLISMILSSAMIFQTTGLLSAMNILNYNSRRFYSLDDILDVSYDTCRITRKIQKYFRCDPDSCLKFIKNFVADSKDLDEFLNRSEYFLFIYLEYALNLRCEISSLSKEYCRHIIQNSNTEHLYKTSKEGNDKLLRFLGYCDTIHMSDDFKSKAEKFPISDVNYEMIDEKTKDNLQINTLYKIILEILKLFRKYPEAVLKKMHESLNSGHITLANSILNTYFASAYSLGKDLGDILLRVYLSESHVIGSMKELETLPTSTLTSAVSDMRNILQEIKNSITPSSEAYEVRKY